MASLSSLAAEENSSLSTSVGQSTAAVEITVSMAMGGVCVYVCVYVCMCVCGGGDGGGQSGAGMEITVSMASVKYAFFIRRWHEHERMGGEW